MKSIKTSTHLLAGAALIALFSVQTLHAKNKPVTGSIVKINLWVNELKTDSAKHEIEFSAQDSAMLSKDHSVITLYGQVKFNCPKFNITADEIAYDKVNDKIRVRNFIMINNQTKITTTGVSGEFQVDSKK